MLTAIMLGMAMAVCAEEGMKREFPTDGIQAVRIQTGSGDIAVHAGEKIIVEVVENKEPHRCYLTIEARDGEIILKAENAKHQFVAGKGCGAGFHVSVPAVLSLDAKADSGNIALNGMSGEVALSLGNGHISGTLSGRLTAKIGSGTIALTGLTSSADVKSNSGEVSLVWAKAPISSVDVTTYSGDVLLVFPVGTKLQANQIASSGATVNKLGDAPEAPLKVSVITGAGNSTIQAAD